MLNCAYVQWLEFKKKIDKKKIQKNKIKIEKAYKNKKKTS